MKKINLTFVFFAVGLVLFFAFFAAGNVTAADSTQRMSNYDGTDEGGDDYSKNSDWHSWWRQSTARTLSGFGQKAVFQSKAQLNEEFDKNSRWDIYVRDTLSGTTTLVSAGARYGYAGDCRGDSLNPAISQNGQYVAFQSDIRFYNDDYFVEKPAAEPWWVSKYKTQIYRRDLVTNTTRRVSVGEYGSGAYGDCENPSISADGTYVAFESEARNLDPLYEDECCGHSVHVYRSDMSTTPPTVQAVSVDKDGVLDNCANNSRNPSLSSDGNSVAFDSWADELVENDTNDAKDVFIRDMTSNTTTLVSVSITRPGYAANDWSQVPSTSGNGRFVAFESWAGDLVAPISGDEDLYVEDVGDGDEFFHNSSQIYVRDTVDNVTYLVSVGFYGYGGDDDSKDPSISMDGRYVAFESDADNLVEDANDNYSNIFVYDRLTGTMTQVNLYSDMSPAYDDDSKRPSISPDGQYVSFDTSEWLTVKGGSETQVYRNDYFDQNGDGVRDGQEVPGAVNTPQNKTVYDYSGTGATVNISTGYDAEITFFESVDPTAALLDTRGTPPASLPCGLVTFTLNVEPGATVRVRLTFPCSLEDGSTYYKYGTTGGWSLYSEVAPDAVSISGNIVDLTITDGGPNDLDGLVNGQIVDPSGPGPAVVLPGTPTPPIAVEGQSDGQGGCFISTLAN